VGARIGEQNGHVSSVNLKTANTLGITVTLPLSGRADELIE
jgi:hypothetical protein